MASKDMGCNKSHHSLSFSSLKLMFKLNAYSSYTEVPSKEKKKLGIWMENI